MNILMNTPRQFSRTHHIFRSFRLNIFCYFATNASLTIFILFYFLSQISPRTGGILQKVPIMKTVSFIDHGNVEEYSHLRFKFLSSRQICRASTSLSYADFEHIRSTKTGHILKKHMFLTPITITY